MFRDHESGWGRRRGLARDLFMVPAGRSSVTCGCPRPWCQPEPPPGPRPGRPGGCGPAPPEGEGSRARWLLGSSGRDEFYLEAIIVLQVGRVVLIAARMRVPVGEHQPPAVALCVRGQLIQHGLGGDVEREMIHPWPAAVMT